MIPAEMMGERGAASSQMALSREWRPGLSPEDMRSRGALSCLP
jgi:hypothetical protein